MISFRSLGAAALAAFTVHPTPAVVMVRHADAIRQSLPAARQFFVRTVTIGREDLARIQHEAGFTPEDPSVRFYLGKDAGGRLEGVVLFPQVNTMHGPLEIGLTLRPDGTVAAVTVTTATVETRPWVEEAEVAGLLGRFEGLALGASAAEAMAPLRARLGAMPWYMATLVAAAVEQGRVLFTVLFRPGQPPATAGAATAG